jgi:hypothetical protein
MAKKQAAVDSKFSVEPVPVAPTREEGAALWRERLRGCELKVPDRLCEWDVLVWEVTDYAILCELSVPRLWDVLWEEVAKIEGLDIPGLARRLNMTTRELAERLESRREMSFEGSVREVLRTLDHEALRRVYED